MRKSVLLLLSGMVPFVSVLGEVSSTWKWDASNHEETAPVRFAGTASREREWADVKLRGWLADRLDLMLQNHVLKTDVGYLTAPFSLKEERSEFWQTEFWGKYMHSAAPFCIRMGSAALKAKIDAGLEDIIAAQEPDGYIGNYPAELRCGGGWDVWGMKYTMLGLIHYSDAFPRTEHAKRAMVAACRLCDYLIAQLGRDGKCARPVCRTGCWSGMASSSVLEPVVWLYKRTGNDRYLDFAKQIVAGMRDIEDGPRLFDLALKGLSPADRNGYGNAKEQGDDYVEISDRRKAYEMMSCYQGLLEYGQLVGDTAFLHAAEATACQLIKDEINLAGGSSAGEVWYHGARKQHLPYVHQQETCVTITWMRLLSKLAAITGKSKYADELEKTFYNAYLASLNRRCDEFAAYTALDGNRSSGHRHCRMHTNCCNANGPRGFLTFLRSVIRGRGNAAIMNFYTSATETVAVPGLGKDVTFDVYTDYPQHGRVQIKCRTPGRYVLSLRIPGWCREATVKINGADAPSKPVSGCYFDIDREWRAGDAVLVDFGMKAEIHRLGHCVAFTRGPVLLARDTRFADGPLDEPLRYGALRGESSLPDFVPVRNSNKDMQMVFGTFLPLGRHWTNENGKLPSIVRFCDYASAANEWTPENACRVWLPEEYGRNE